MPGHQVTIVEEGPSVDPDALEPFSLEEMVAKYRHRGGTGALGQPPVAYTEGRCVGGSTEVNSGLWHRLPTELTEQWRLRYQIDEFDPDALDRRAAGIEDELTVSLVPGEPPPSSAILRDGAEALGWRSQEFPRVFRYDEAGRGTKQTMTRTLLPRATRAGATIVPDCRITRLVGTRPHVTGARARLTRPDGTSEDIEFRADHVFVCGGAVHSPALLQRSGIRHNIGRGLKLHPTIKIAARFPDPLDHDDVPMHRITEFAPYLTIGGSASRRGHVAMALAESAAPFEEALADWQHVSVYYAAIRSEGSGLVVALPGMASPLVTYRLTPARLQPAGPRPGPPGRGTARRRCHRAVSVGARRRRRPQPRRSRRLVGPPHPPHGEPHDRAPHLEHPHGRGLRPHRHRQLRAGARGGRTCG